MHTAHVMEDSHRIENGMTTVPTHREGHDKVCTATEAGCHKGGMTKRSPPATIKRTHVE